MVDSYLIEIRLFGKIKHDIRKLNYQLSQDCEINIKNRLVPHITLVGGFVTNNESKLLQDFEVISRELGLIGYTIEMRIDAFSDNGVVYWVVKPSKELIFYRRKLRDKLQSYCNLHKYDYSEPFMFHSTIAMNITRAQAECIKRKIGRNKKYDLRMLRVTLLKNGKILEEYDFCLRRTLNRQKSLSRQVCNETFKKFNDVKNQWLPLETYGRNILIRVCKFLMSKCIHE